MWALCLLRGDEHETVGIFWLKSTAEKVMIEGIIASNGKNTYEIVQLDVA